MKILVDVSKRYACTGVGKYSEFLTKSLESAPDIRILRLAQRSLIPRIMQDVSLIFLSCFKNIIFPEERFLYVALLCRRSQTVVIHDMRWMQRKDLKSKIISLGFKKAQKRKWSFVSASPVVSNELRNIDTQVNDLFNCVEFSGNSIKSLGLNKLQGQKIQLLYVGSFEPRKNIVKLLNLIGGSNLCQLTIVSSKFYWDRRQLTENIDETIRLLGSKLKLKIDVSDGELSKIYLDSDAYISLSEYEGFGRPLIEAQSAGLPVMALGLPQTTLVLANSFFDIRPHSELDLAIVKLTANYGKYQSAGLRNAERYSYPNFCKASRGIFL